jgi:polyisoprenoid-binding protein YceI
MKPHSFAPSAGLALALLLALPLGAAENTVRYEGQPGSKLRIDGDSSVHAWSVESQIIGGFMEFEANFPDSAAQTPTAVNGKVEVAIPVRSLKSGKRPMDNIMYETMKQAQHPKIEYRLLELKPKKAAGSTPEFDAKGALTVAGVTRTNTMPVTVQRVDQTKLKVTGTANLKMTDFGMKPPSPPVPLVGKLITTADDVKITFEWLTGQGNAKAP